MYSAYLTAPIHYVAHLPVDSGQWLTEQAQSRSSLMEENQRLQRQSLILEQKVQRLAVLEAENVRLRELLNSSADLDANVLVAEIIGVDPDPNRQELVINKGTGSDVFRGQAVLDAQGLIGQVVDAGPLSSRVLLLTDASHAMSVQVNRNGVRAVLAGNAQTGLRLLYVPDTADIEEGDFAGQYRSWAALSAWLPGGDGDFRAPPVRCALCRHYRASDCPNRQGQPRVAGSAYAKRLPVR